MKPVLRLLSVAACLWCIVSSSSPAQIAQYEEPYYRIPPAVTGNKGKVFFGSQKGVIYYSTQSDDTTFKLDSLVAGNQLPPELAAVWYLSMPDKAAQPNLIVGIASYTVPGDTAARRYGVLRSNDLGVSWTLIKPADFVDANMKATNDFYRHPFGKMTWLDASRGWIFGNKGIFKTVDGGLNWQKIFSSNNDTALVKEMVFKDPDNGVAVMGTYPRGRAIKDPSKLSFAVTTDGGATWETSTYSLAPKLVTQLDWIGNEYRAVAIDPFQISSNCSLLVSRDVWGYQWTARLGMQVITREQSLMTKVIWMTKDTGYLTSRSGELWRTGSASKSFVTWEQVQNADSTVNGYPMPSSYNARTGFGYDSFVLDNMYIVQASTLRATGELHKRPRWLIGSLKVGVPEELSAASGMDVFPNPASGNTRVRFELASKSNVSLSVTDILGTEKLHSDLGSLEAGEHTFPLDLSTLPAGTYRYIIKAGAKAVAGTVVVVR